MSDNMYDAIVLGGGLGGFAAAVRVRQLGGKSCIVEHKAMGGTCLNRGCIPTKALIASAEMMHLARHADVFGINIKGDISCDFAKIMERKKAIVNKLVGGIEFSCKTRGIDVIYGKGRLKDPNTVIVEAKEGTKEIKGKSIVMATGSEPLNIPAFNIDGKNILTSTEALELTEVPSSLIIIGAGAVGCEFACIFNEFGSKVTMLEMMPQVMPTEDREVANVMRVQLKKRGIEIFLKKKIEGVSVSGGKVKAVLEGGIEVEADKALVSIGRKLNVDSLGLEDIGVKKGQRNEIVVDSKMRTNIPNIYAVGDVSGKILLAHVASVQGLIAAQNIMGHARDMDYRSVPACIFTYPEVSSVGLSETKAKEQGIDIATGQFFFSGSGKAMAMEETAGFVKIVAEKGTDKLIGMSIVGPRASDLILEGALAIRLGLKVQDVAETIHAHPSLGEAVLEAAEDVHKKSIYVVN